jgi:hypothetical protein
VKRDKGRIVMRKRARRREIKRGRWYVEVQMESMNID